MNKRILTLFVVLLLLFSMLLTGCGETITSITQTSDNAPESSKPDSEDGIPIVENAETLGIMTFNLRYDVSSHPCMALSIRGPHLMQIIDKYAPDSVGFNEATGNWMSWLRGNMKQRGYAYVGVGRDSGTDNINSTTDANEYSPIFYKEDKFELLDSGTFWLSKTPASPKTTGWGANLNRICTYAVLKNKATGEVYAHFSTHLDHEDMEAQENSVYIIETYIRTVLDKFGDIGVVLTGDFNASAFQKNDPTFDPFTYNGVTSYMDDTRYIAAKTGMIGKIPMGYDPEKWEEAFQSDKNKPIIDVNSSPIDYIFVKKNAYECSYYTVVTDSFTFEAAGKTWHNHPVSDHYGVFAQVKCIKPATPFTKDDSKLIDHKATISTTLPDGLLPKFTDAISIESTFKAKNQSSAIENLLKDDDSITSIAVGGNVHGYWEITLAPEAIDKCFTFSGLSFKTASGTHPFNLRVFVSTNGKDWEQVGASYDKKLTANTTYYVKTDEIIKTNFVKLVFTDTPNNAKLNNITIFAESLNNGRITSDRITVTAGPNFNASNSCENLFDSTSAKFYFRQYESGKVPANPAAMEAIFFETDTPVTIAHYNMVNADSDTSASKLPRKWTLYGSTDGTTWKTIDSRTQPTLSAVNGEANNFTAKTPGSYKYYKLVFLCGTNGTVQFGEMELFEAIS